MNKYVNAHNMIALYPLNGPLLSRSRRSNTQQASARALWSWQDFHSGELKGF